MAILLLLTLASGFWLSSAGKPLNSWIFNLHKLIALGAVIYSAVILAGLFKVSANQAVFSLMLILAAVCVIALFATGAIMSIGRGNYTLMRIIHAITPVPALIALGVMAWVIK